MSNSAERTYALLADSQQELDRFLGPTGNLSDAPGIEGLTLDPPLQARGNFRIYGDLEEDAFGKKRSGTSVEEAIRYVIEHPNSVLGVTSIEQISPDIHTLLETLEEIHAAGSGIIIRFFSRALEHRFNTPGEHNGWIWIGDTLADFIEQVRIAVHFNEMFHPNPWSKIPNSEIYEVWDKIRDGKNNVTISKETGISQKTIAVLKKRFKKLETIYRKL